MTAADRFVYLRRARDLIDLRYAEPLELDVMAEEAARAAGPTRQPARAAGPTRQPAREAGPTRQSAREPGEE